MPPNQDAQPPAGHDPYAFIMQGTPKQKKSLLPSGNSRKQRIILGAGLLGIVLIFGIVMLLIFNSGGGSLQPMVGLAQTQNEILRISQGSTSDLKSSASQSFDQNITMVVTSDQQATLAYISKQQKAPKSKELALKTDTSTDETLKKADQSGRYDEAFDKIMYEKLVAYRDEINTVYESATGVKQKELLKQLYDNVNTLLKNQPAPSTN